MLVDEGGAVLGALAPFAVETPWWQDLGPVVAGARSRFGARVVILRLLSAERRDPPGVAVTYVAQIEGDPPALEPWTGTLQDHLFRLSYAKPGGPAADLAWATAALAVRGIGLTGAAQQVRTWNLSSLWRLPTSGGAVWMKVVPPFLAHEGALLARLDGEAVPKVLARDGGRLLLAEIPGDDLHGAPPDRLAAMVTLLVDMQGRWFGQTEALLDLGLPDRRYGPLTAAIVDVVERTASELTGAERAVLRRFVAGLPARMAQIAACGLGDTLVHGDFHPGNLRGEAGGALTLLDWGDSVVGHPLLDQPAFLDRIDPAHVPALRDHWIGCWRAAVPGSDPARAASLLAPAAAARQAAVYRGFLDRIEPSEHPYHRADPAERLRRAAALAAS
ncbi:MAG: phosphotransferase [Caulobacteraceae bacterium]